jgi:hypothetical protein
MATEQSDPLLNHLCSALFLVAEAESEIQCPVVTLQQDPANVYSLLEKYFRSEALPAADRFWRNVRLLPAAFAVWRPRVNGIQLKMLQHARLPWSEGEWAAVQAALEQLSDAMLPGKSGGELLQELRTFCVTVEQWWAGRRRADGTGSKRPLSNGQQQLGGGSKRVALDGLHFGLASTLPLQLAFPPPHIPSFPALHFHGGGELPGLAAMEAQLPRAASGMEPAAGSGAAGSSGSSRLVTLNVGGQRFCTTPATLEAVEGSYFSILSRKAAATGKVEFFIDRSGAVFQLVLDHLRNQRYNDRAAAVLPEDQLTLQLVQKEASYYCLPALEQQAAAALAAADKAPPAEELSAIFLSALVRHADELDEVHAELMQRLNAKLEAKHAEGWAVVKRDGGTEQEGAGRSLFYHILLSRPRLPA